MQNRTLQIGRRMWQIAVGSLCAVALAASAAVTTTQASNVQVVTCTGPTSTQIKNSATFSLGKRNVPSFSVSCGATGNIIVATILKNTTKGTSSKDANSCSNASTCTSKAMSIAAASTDYWTLDYKICFNTSPCTY